MSEYTAQVAWQRDPLGGEQARTALATAYGGVEQRMRARTWAVGDGFTMADLVSYERKHNESNGEGNRDGDPNNNSWSAGAEGPSKDPEVVAIRQRQVRNMLATLLLSQGRRCAPFGNR